MVKIKPLMPNLRQKKRYLAIEVISDKKIGAIDPIFRSVRHSLHESFGDHGLSESGMMLLRNKSSAQEQRILVKVAHKAVDMVRASLLMIRKIDNIDCIVRCIGASGMLNKAYSKYIVQ
jgi:RNase P/RNase MRP subunit POP5